MTQDGFEEFEDTEDNFGRVNSKRFHLEKHSEVMLMHLVGEGKDVEYISKKSEQLKPQYMKFIEMAQETLEISFGRALLLLSKQKFSQENAILNKKLLEDIYTHNVSNQHTHTQCCLICSDDLNLETNSNIYQSLEEQTNDKSQEKLPLSTTENKYEIILIEEDIQINNTKDDDILDEGGQIKGEDKKADQECSVINQSTIEEKPQQSKSKYSLCCNHNFCTECFRNYIQSIFSEGSTCIFKTCPQEGCLERLGRDDFEKFLSPSQFELYDNFLFSAIFSISEAAIQCPAPNCQFFQVSLKEGQSLKKKQRNITCTCTFEYCNLCKDQGHFPCNCEDFKKWTNKIDVNEVGSINDPWLVMNTKQCPNCKINIEKNQGCLHMTCKQCSHHFCWICLGKWSLHNDYFNCSLFDEKKLKEEEEKKKDKAHFAFHRSHYESHMANINVVRKEIKQIADDLNNTNIMLKRNNQKPFETKQIQLFCDQILRGRKCLPFLYSMGFSIFDQNKLDLFKPLLEDYVRIIDLHNLQLNSFKNIIESVNDNSGRITLKTSFVTALRSLPEQLISCSKYISLKLIQFRNVIEKTDQVIKTNKFDITSVNSTQIFQKKREKLAAKEKEKQRKQKIKQQKVICIESNCDSPIIIDEGSPQNNKETSFSDLPKKKPGQLFQNYLHMEFSELEEEEEQLLPLSQPQQFHLPANKSSSNAEANNQNSKDPVVLEIGDDSCEQLINQEMQDDQSNSSNDSENDDAANQVSLSQELKKRLDN